MRRIPLVLSLVLLTACEGAKDHRSAREDMLALPVATPVAGKRVTLPKADDAIGSVIVRTKDITIRGLGELEDKRITYVMIDRGVRELEVLAIASDAPTKARVTYREESFEHRQDGQLAPWTPRLRGNTYIAEWRDGALRVMREDNKAMDAEEEERLRSDLATELGHPDPTGGVLAKYELESGRVVPLPTAAMAASIADNVTVRRAEARLIDVRDGIASLETYVEGDVNDAERRTFESRDISEHSTETGRVMRIKGWTSLRTTTKDGIRLTNRVEGVKTFAYR